MEVRGDTSCMTSCTTGSGIECSAGAVQFTPRWGPSWPVFYEVLLTNLWPCALSRILRASVHSEITRSLAQSFTRFYVYAHIIPTMKDVNSRTTSRHSFGMLPATSRHSFGMLPATRRQSFVMGPVLSCYFDHDEWPLCEGGRSSFCSKPFLLSIAPFPGLG